MNNRDAGRARRVIAITAEAAEFTGYVIACAGRAAWWVLRAAIILACMLFPAIFEYILNNI